MLLHSKRVKLIAQDAGRVRELDEAEGGGGGGEGGVRRILSFAAELEHSTVFWSWVSDQVNEKHIVHPFSA